MRGGGQISPIEVDGALLSHPAVAEAVSFGAPDEKYGEEVAAAVVLAKGAPPPSEALKDDIRKHVASSLSKFKARLSCWSPPHKPVLCRPHPSRDRTWQASGPSSLGENPNLLIGQKHSCWGFDDIAVAVVLPRLLLPFRLNNILSPLL